MNGYLLLPGYLSCIITSLHKVCETQKLQSNTVLQYVGQSFSKSLCQIHSKIHTATVLDIVLEPLN